MTSISPGQSGNAWIGTPQRSPVITFVGGPEAKTVCEKLGNELNIHVLDQVDEKVIEGVKKCYNLFVQFKEKSEIEPYIKQMEKMNLHACYIQVDSVEEYSHIKDTLEPELSKKGDPFAQHAEEEDNFKRLKDELDQSALSPFDALKALDEKYFMMLVPVDAVYEFNRIILNSDIKTPASKVNFKSIDHTCPNFIVTRSPHYEPYLFWSMVFEKDLSVIVQLNSENDYLPLHSEEILLFQDLQISLSATMSYLTKESTERLFQSTLEIKKGDVSKKVTHYLIENWVDGEPIRDLNVLNELFTKIDEHTKTNFDLTPLVHCKAGVGRTGTFLGAYLIHYLTQSSPVKHCVDKEALAKNTTLFLRAHRYQAVFTPEQFEFLNSLTYTQ